MSVSPRAPGRANIGIALAVLLALTGFAIAGCGCDMTPDGLGDPNTSVPNDPNTGNPSPPAPGAGDPNDADTPGDTPDGTPGDATPDLDCLACHSMAQGVRRPIVNDTGGDRHTKTLTNDVCGLCHDVSRHQSGAVRLWATPGREDSVLVLSGDPTRDAAADETLTTFCNKCHRPTHYEVHDPAGGWTVGCGSCHSIHDPDGVNLSLVRGEIFDRASGELRPVTFTALTGPGSFSDGAGAADGICQICHSSTAFHRNDGSGAAHMEGENCTECHTHESGFAAGEAGACVQCHNVAQGSRRAVLGEFALASHHVQSGQPDSADCLVCHDVSKHRRGSVLLRDADAPESIVTLTGDPLVNISEAAKLAPFCLSCHDSDGAGGEAPFSDGVMPAAIDADLWALASHNSGQTTCVGDGETFGCHSTGHGSMKANLLAPWDLGSQPPTAGDPLRQEEGLCYSCHDADGPAATDVEAMFARSSVHNVSADDQTDGSKVECVNCHDPHVARSGSLLIDPDSGDVWKGAEDRFCLTCHDGGAPTGVAFPPVSPGTGYDKSDFVGSSHDQQTGPASCRHCHLSHGAGEPALLRAKYVTDDYNEYSFGDGDYAICWLCHGELETINLFNAFEDRHHTHVRGGDAPCIACHDVHAPFDRHESGLINLAWPLGAGYDMEFIAGYDGSSSFWIEPGGARGGCAIVCHGEEHDPETYARSPTSATDCSACH